NITDSDVNLATDYFMSNAAALTVTENVDNTINTLSIQDMDNNFNDGDSGVAPLTTTTKSELVASTAQNMGITLDTSEISLIAENISNSSDDFDQDIDAIKAAIMAFIDHKSMINQSKINELIYEVRDLVGNKNQENSQLLSDGLKQINSDIQEANKQFKSGVQRALAAFTIPTIKAG
ncbi:MAG: hypothetical protein ACKPB7_00105, partial [Sphaerospermopsis kisseleviana]